MVRILFSILQKYKSGRESGLDKQLAWEKANEVTDNLMYSFEIVL